MKRLLGSALLLLIMIVPWSAQAFVKPPATVTILGSDTPPATYSIPSGNDAGGLSVAVADLGDDGVAELIVGNGLGNEPRVRVLRNDGSEIGSFLAYDKTVGIGVHVTTCDIDGDGYQEIIVAPQRGGGPHVRIFSRYGKPIDNGGFFAYGATMTSGINLACGELNDTPGAELVTLPGPSAGPHIKIWTWDAQTQSMQLSQEFFDGEQTDTRGRIGTIQEGFLTTVTEQGTSATLSKYSTKNGIATIETTSLTLPFFGANALFVHKGMWFIAGSSDGILYNITENTSQTYTSPYGSITAASGDITGDGEDDIVVVPYRPLIIDDAAPKHIIVDISEQRLYAYEGGLLANTFLVSTAKAPWVTPLGEHSVLAKLPYVHYKWSYGAGDPNNYDLGVIPYNLRIYPHIYIHYAPWHNNFGIPMSHGCINVNLENSEWIFAWAEEGVPVTVQE